MTLIEACTVVAVVALVAGAAAPSFDDTLVRRRLEGRASELATDLHLLRTEAVARNRPLRIGFESSADASCYVLYSGAEGACHCDGEQPARCAPGSEAIKSVHLPASRRVRVASRSPSIVFDPVRGTATPTATLSVSDAKGREIRHVVSVMGRIRSCSVGGAAGGYKPC